MHTVGHGTLSVDDFIALLLGAGTKTVIDVRSFPGSRHNPQFRREAMERWLPAGHLSYHWTPAPGGRRRPVEQSPHLALRHTGFRAYADHMETEAFRAGVDELLSIGRAKPTAVMCSESVRWRCHRRLFADHLVLSRGVEVIHLMHDVRRTLHVLTDGVRRDGARLMYDVGCTPSFPID